MIESLGIPNDIVLVSKEIIESIIENYLNLSDDYDEEYYDDFNEYLNDACDDAGIDSVYYNDSEYYYGFYYQPYSNSKGQYSYDDNAVMINYKGILNIVEEADKLFGYGEEEMENRKEYIKTSLYEYLLPILTHELTHSKDEYGEAQGKWLGSHYKGHEEDLRTFLYTFSENEMNARIGSIGGLVTSYIENTCFNIEFTREDFNELTNEILSDNDLQLRYMELLVDMLDRELEEFESTQDKKSFRQYSLIFDLFKNDNRLKNNRTLKKMFLSNSYSAYNYVRNFYDKLYNKFRQRALRAIYQAWQMTLRNQQQAVEEE